MDWYNDIDEKACHWMRALIAAELVPGGEVDGRSIQEVTGAELRDYRRCHFFAGIAGWAEALRLAEWPDALPVWTGSCPCQPFSVAGKGKGTADERHVWPEFRRLIDECRPPIVFGEQVASKLGRAWLASVRDDLERMDYAVGSADLPACSVGAPHIRQRLYWVGYSNSAGSFSRKQPTEGARHGSAVIANGRDNHWFDVEWIACADGKTRPVKPGIQLLATGIQGRVAQLRGLGNSIVPQIAAVFIKSVMEVLF